MQPSSSQTEINGRISATLLARTRPDKSTIEALRLAALLAQFRRSIEKDGAVLAAVVRSLRAPRGTARHDVECFADFVRGIIRQEANR